MFVVVFGLIIATGFYRSPNVALGILNMGLISAIMAMGVNMQWGYAGLFNVGVMGFVALGGVAAVLVSMDPVPEAWAAGGLQAFAALILAAVIIVGAIAIWGRMSKGIARNLAMLAILVVGFLLFRTLFDSAVAAIEKVNPAATGFLGGLGLPIIMSWPDKEQLALSYYRTYQIWML